MDRLLAHEGVHGDAGGIQRCPDVPHRPLHPPGDGGPIVQARLLRLELVGPLREVPTVIAVLGYRGSSVAGEEAGGVAVHLTTSVVEVVLPPHVETGSRQQVAEGITEETTPGVADVEWPGGIGRHELDEDPVAGPHRGATEIVGGRPPQHLMQPRMGEAEVEEPGPGDVHAFEVRDAGQVGFHQLRHLPRTLARLLRGGEGDVGRPVAVVGVAGSLDFHRDVELG